MRVATSAAGETAIIAQIALEGARFEIGLELCARHRGEDSKLLSAELIADTADAMELTRI